MCWPWQQGRRRPPPNGESVEDLAALCQVAGSQVGISNRTIHMNVFIVKFQQCTDKNYGMFQATLLPQRALHRAWSHRDSNSHKGSDVSRLVFIFRFIFHDYCIHGADYACLLFHCDQHRWRHLQNWDLGKCSKGEPLLIVNHINLDFLQINIREPKTLS